LVSGNLFEFFTVEFLLSTNHSPSLKRPFCNRDIWVLKPANKWAKLLLKWNHKINFFFLGSSGLGKSTLVNTIFKSKVSRRQPDDDYATPKTVEIKSISHGKSLNKEINDKLFLSTSYFQLQSLKHEILSYKLFIS